MYYNSKTFKVEPKLATSWKEMSPTQYRFNLRKGVKFSDGSNLTADDVVFSLDRARAKTSNFNVYTQGFSRIVKVDANTVDIILSGPNPVLLNQLTELRIMSKAWAEKNKSVEPKDAKVKDENFAHRNAMGQWCLHGQRVAAGPKTGVGEKPQLVGLGGGPHQRDRSHLYTPIKNEATRAAALLSGEIDFVLDPSPQDLGRMRSNANLKVVDGVENRTIFLGMDQHRDELPGSSVKGKNPLKDVKVRKALYQAIDIETIHRVTMRGLSQNTGALVAPQVSGWTEGVNKRFPYSMDDSKKLLAEAGYPQGFEVDFACPNNRYINDEEICQAITAMWAKVGVKAKLRTMPLVTYFPMIQRYEASIYMLGWGVPTFDALYSLQSLVRTVGTGGDGNYNVGRYSNTRMDYVVDRIKTETDLPVRNRLLTEGLQLSNDTVSHIPLHNQVIPWAMKKNVDLVHRADNRLDWTLIKVNLMLAFILQRLIQAVVVMVTVAFIAFLLFQYVGDPVVFLLGQDATKEQIDLLRADLGLDQPFFVQFWNFLANAVQGEFGLSLRQGAKVSRLIAERLPATLELALVAATLALAIGIPMGVYAALRRGTWASQLIMTISLLGVSLPTFLIGILLILVFAVMLGWFPSFGRGDVVQMGFWSSGLMTAKGWHHITLPAVTLAIFQLTLIMRLVRAEMLEVLRTDYIKFARARGLSNRTIHFGHALKNTLVPVLTITGLQLWRVDCICHHHRDRVSVARHGLLFHSGGDICRHSLDGGLFVFDRADFCDHQFGRGFALLCGRSAPARGQARGALSMGAALQSVLGRGAAFTHITRFHPELTAFRRDLHAHPELGFEEVYTSARVADMLKVCGVDSIPPPHWSNRCGGFGARCGQNSAKPWPHDRLARRHGRLAPDRVERLPMEIVQARTHARVWPRRTHRHADGGGPLLGRNPTL